MNRDQLLFMASADEIKKAISKRLEELSKLKEGFTSAPGQAYIQTRSNDVGWSVFTTSSSTCCQIPWDEEELQDYYKLFDRLPNTEEIYLQKDDMKFFGLI